MLVHKPPRKIESVLRTVIVAMLPAGIFYYATQYAKFEIAHPIKDYMEAGLVLWVVIVLLSSFDPLLEKRISTLRDLAGVLRGGKKE